MVGSGHNPARRNRNIGTKAQGYKKRNAFAIPTPDHGAQRFYETLVNPVTIPMQLGAHHFAVMVEPPLEGFRYYVSIPDIKEVLKLVPPADLAGIDVIALRQPKRKERIFSPVWGRMAYWADFGEYQGVSIVIEAVELDYRYKVGKHIDPVFADELKLLEADGHRLSVGKRSIEVTCPPEAIRHTQLFRTLTHEIGHNVDFEEKVTAPCDRGEGDWDELRGLYFARPQREREAFADKYAARVMAPYRQQDIVPFPPLTDAFNDLPSDWFYFATPSR